MKLLKPIKFNITSSHLLFLMIAEALWTIADLFNGNYGHAILSLLLTALWYFNYCITYATVEMMGEEKYCLSKTIIQMKVIAAVCLFGHMFSMNTGVNGVASFLAVIAFAWVIQDIYKLRSEKIKGWFKSLNNRG